MRDWRFPCHVQRVVDGDTLDVLLDIGFNLTKATRVRLVGVNTPELHGIEKPLGEVAKQATIDWLDRHHTDETSFAFELQTHTKEDHFGRCLGTLWAPEDLISLNDYLRVNGLAEELRP